MLYLRPILPACGFTRGMARLTACVGIVLALLEEAVRTHVTEIPAIARVTLAFPRTLPRSLAL